MGSKLKRQPSRLEDKPKEESIHVLITDHEDKEELGCDQKLSLSGGKSALKFIFTVSYSSLILLKVLTLKRRLPNNAVLYLKQYC